MQEAAPRVNLPRQLVELWRRQRQSDSEERANLPVRLPLQRLPLQCLLLLHCLLPIRGTRSA